MRKIKWSIDTGYCGANYSDEFEVPDDYSDAEIEAIITTKVWECITVEWEEETE